MADWWNSVELWVAGLAFPLQFALVVVFLGPLCVGVAWVIDRGVDHASTWFRRGAAAEPPLGAEPPPAGGEEAEAKAEEHTEDLVDSVTS